MTAARRGLLVALEGIDGVGKSTLQRSLARALRRAGVRVALWREPYDPSLRSRALSAGPSQPWTAALFFTIDRAWAHRELRRRRRRSDVVLSDRSYYSTLAYQGSALPPRERRALAEIQPSVTDSPDLVFWLRLPPGQALGRVDARGERRTSLERLRTLQRVSRAYANLARRGRWVVLDARRPMPSLTSEAVAEVTRRLGRPARRARR